MKILTGRVLQNGLMAVFLLALLLAAIRLWPHPPLWQGLPQSSVYYDRHGALLRITLANDDRYRLWTPLEQVSPLAVRGLLLHEDRWFYYNPGFNPVNRPVNRENIRMVMVSTRIRPKRSLRWPKITPPSTAPISVQVTSEPAADEVNPNSMLMAGSIKPRISRSNPSMA